MRRKKNIYELQRQRVRIIIEATKRLTQAHNIRFHSLCLQRTIMMYSSDTAVIGDNSKFKKVTEHQVQELQNLLQHYLHQEQRYQNIIDSIRYFTNLFYAANDRLNSGADKPV